MTGNTLRRTKGKKGRKTQNKKDESISGKVTDIEHLIDVY